MSFDNSRFTFDPWRDYYGVVMEQGRVQLDSDWNEWLAEFARRIQAATMDALGRTGVPYITPYAFQITATKDDSGSSHIAIGAGRMYVDGLLAENHGLAVSWQSPVTAQPAPGVQWDPALDELSGAPQLPSVAEVTVDFSQQPYLPGATVPTGKAPLTFLAYLDVWRRPVTYIEDPNLIEKAVGVDTTGRLQTVWQVKLLDVTSVAGVTCSTPGSSIPSWQSLIQPSAGQLTTNVVQSASSGPCCLSSNTGYTGQENQLYRVQIHRAGINGWQPGRAYGLGAEIIDSNGNLERVTVAGASGAKAPAWPTTIGSTVTDGTVTWQLETTSYKPLWSPNTVYASGVQVVDSNGNLETAVAAGTSGSAPPTWPTSSGTPVSDGTTGLMWQYGLSATPTFKWSRDNASVLTTVTGITPVTNTAGNSASQLAVESLGRDQVLGFAPGNWVEITDAWQELNGQHGELHQIDSIDASARTITLDSPVSSTSFPTASGQTDPGRHTRLIRWDQSGKVYLSDGVTVWVDLGATGSTGEIRVPPVGTALILENGATVEFSLSPANGSFYIGDFWTFAARTADGSVELLTQVPPHGIEHHYSRLALLSFDGTNWSELCDCRSFFPPAAQRAGIHVTGVLALDANNNPSPLQNDGTLPVTSLLGGIRVLCDLNVAPASVKRPTCFLAVEWPFAFGPEALRQFYFPAVVPADVGAESNVIFWRPQSDYSTGTTPVALAAADFNGDGHLDVAVVNQGDQNVSILLGNGDGTLTAAPPPFPFTGNTPVAIASADFSGSGIQDLAVVNQANGSVSILLGNGDGTFLAPPATAPVLSAVAPAANTTPPPPGAYQVEVTYVSPSGETNPSPAGSITTTGNGQPVQVSSPSASGKATGWNVYLTTAGGSTFFRQNTSPIAIGTNWTQSANINTSGATPPTPPVTGNTPIAIVVADFNGDNHPDLAVVNKGDSTVSVFLGNGNGSFKAATITKTGAAPVALATSDFNGDKKPDLAIVQANNTVAILLGNGDGTFALHATPATGTTPIAIAVADFNGDSKPDLAVVNQGDNTVSILLGDGTGAFTATAVSPPAGPKGNIPLALVAADFNGDNKQDLAVLTNPTAAGSPGSVSILLGNGDGTFQPFVSYTVGVSPVALAAGDFTGDGNLDLAVIEQGDKAVSILLGNGDGTFQPRVRADWLLSLPNSIPAGDKGILARLTLKGNCIWAQSDPQLYLDGDTFGVTQTDSAGRQSTGLSLPSGDFRQGGDFQMWFWLTPAPLIQITTTPASASSTQPALNFGTLAVGVTSKPQTVTLTNVGNLPITISNITISGDFAESNTCMPSFVPIPRPPLGLQIQAAVPARPVGTGLKITGSQVNLATRSVSAVKPSAVAAATTTPAKAFQPIASAGISLGGGIFPRPFPIPFPFPSVGVLQPGSSCTINVTFTPTGFGERTGTLTIIDSAVTEPGAAASPHVIKLSGFGAFFEIGVPTGNIPPITGLT